MSQNSSIAPLTIVLEALIKQGFVIYSGAGISIPAPSCAPSWWTITEEILESFFARIPDKWGLPKDLIIYDPDRQPESVFENFANMLDLRLYEIFKVLDLSEPNENHKIIAKLAKSGILKACITTNFDTFIERALKEEGVEFHLLVENRDYNEFVSSLTTQSRSPRLTGNEKFILCKIHGTISKPDTIVSVASAYKSSKGFSIPKADLISLLLKTYPVLFMGYSGWDFEHINYRRFWDRVGPQCKGIYWNKRPSETGGPNLQEIFKDSLRIFQMCSGELPTDFLTGVLQTHSIPIAKSQQFAYTKESSAEQFKIFKEKRMEFMRQWARNIPDFLAHGLVLSEASQFSQQFKETVKSLHELSEERDIISYSGANVVQELAQKLSNKEISMEEYQAETQKFLLQTRMSLIKKSFRPKIMEWIQTNKFPSITDNQMRRDMWLGFLGAFTANFDLETAAQLTLTVMEKYNKYMGKIDPESQAEMLITGYLPSLMHPKKVLWEPFYQQMLAEKARFLKGEISYDTLRKAVADILQRSTNAKLGITIPMKTLYEELISGVGKSINSQDIQQGCEALFLCLDSIAGYIFSDMLREQEVMTNYTEIATSIQQTNQVNESLMEFFDSRIRNIFQPILAKIQNYGHGQLSIPYLLLEASILKVWNVVLPNIDVNQMKKYTTAWDEGKYPIRFTNASLYKFIRRKIDTWLGAALKNFPTRLLQKLLGVLATIAEGGNDFDWLRQITQKSLELTEGMVTEATPMNIPGSLAGLFEMNGDLDNALKYYTLALDAIRTAIPPIWQDAIIYRAAYLTTKTSVPDAQMNAFKIIAQYHPDFHGNAGIIKMPARQFCKQLAETIAHNLGYGSADVMMQTLFP